MRREVEGSPRYWAWLYSPPRLRAVLDALLGIEEEIRAALRPGLDHHVAHVRLEWWREECARCASGSPAHPQTRALRAACPAAASGAARLEPGGLIDTAAWDLAAATFATRAELTAYCDRWASAVTLIAAEAAAEWPCDRPAHRGRVAQPLESARPSGSAQPPESAQPRGSGGSPAREAAARLGRSLGRALKEIELLADLAPDARLGRLRLPLDELEQAGVEPSALARPPWPAPLCDLLRARQRASRAALAESVAALPGGLQPALRGLIVWAAAAHQASLRAEQALPHPPRAGAADRLADTWLGWRAARLADRRKFRLNPEASP